MAIDDRVVDNDCFECEFLGLCRGGRCGHNHARPGCARSLYVAASGAIVEEAARNGRSGGVRSAHIERKEFAHAGD